MDPPKVSATFPEGSGDLCLISNDGTLFYVHIQLLQLSSPVFATMCEIGNSLGKVGNGPADPVRIEADAETLEILLQFIYPLWPNPRSGSLQELETLLSLAHRYELDGVTEQLRAVLIETRVEEDTVSKPFYEKSPVETFAIASTYQLIPEARLALRECLTMDATILFQRVEETNLPGKMITFMLRLRQQRMSWFTSKLDREIPDKNNGAIYKRKLEHLFNQRPDLDTVRGTVLSGYYASISPSEFQEWEREWNEMQAKLPEFPSK